MDVFAPLRLGATIVLGAMTFLFGSSARTMFDTQPFRTPMYMRSADELSARSGSPRVLQRHAPDALQLGRDGLSWWIMTEAFGRTCIIVVPHTSGMSVHMAIAGQFLTSCQFDADTNSIRVDGLSASDKLFCSARAPRSVRSYESVTRQHGAGKKADDLGPGEAVILKGLTRGTNIKPTWRR